MKDKEISNYLYLGYFSRITLFAMSFILLFILSLFCFKKSIGYESSEQTSFHEKGTINYKVNLRDNYFYESNVLDEDMSYIADLVNSIDVNVDYSIIFNMDFKGKVDYKITGNLIITNADESKNFLDNKYILYEDSNIDNINNVFYKIDKTVNIDYRYYRDLANSFKKNFGVNSKAYLYVYLTLTNEEDTNIMDIIDGKNGLGLKISLDGNEVSIDKNIDSLDNKKLILSNSKVEIANKKLFILGILFLLLDLILLSYLGKLLMILTPKRSKYDITLDNILKTYDKEIVNCKTLPEFSKKHIIKVDNFKELLDAFKIIQLPIMYVNVSTHNKCHFYIIHNDDVYLYTLKAVDLEKEGN